ncbi:unnamed protein product [Symbiodinium natans]|uniref:Uncharacterized protein n=1 Tax=Symbiodinium natans TaxID=878477 RepID=A0A812UQR3_9DINO|nr:unnamed protein product [Symbiodinium natans]
MDICLGPYSWQARVEAAQAEREARALISRLFASIADHCSLLWLGQFGVTLFANGRCAQRQSTTSQLGLETLRLFTLVESQSLEHLDNLAETPDELRSGTGKRGEVPGPRHFGCHR